MNFIIIMVGKKKSLIICKFIETYKIEFLSYIFFYVFVLYTNH
jgi:hypothetical protein